MYLHLFSRKVTIGLFVGLMLLGCTTASVFGQTTSNETLNQMVPDSVLQAVLTSSNGPVTLAVESFPKDFESNGRDREPFSLFEYPMPERNIEKIRELLKQVRVDTAHYWQVYFCLTSFGNDSLMVARLMIIGRNGYRFEKFGYQDGFTSYYYTELYFRKGAPEQKEEYFFRLLSNNAIERKRIDYQNPGKTEVQVDTMTQWESKTVKFR